MDFSSKAKCFMHKSDVRIWSSHCFKIITGMTKPRHSSLHIEAMGKRAATPTTAGGGLPNKVRHVIWWYKPVRWIDCRCSPDYTSSSDFYSQIYAYLLIHACKYAAHEFFFFFRNLARSQWNIRLNQVQWPTQTSTNLALAPIERWSLPSFWGPRRNMSPGL